MSSLFDILPFDLVLLILLELPKSKVKEMVNIYPRVRNYYTNNKERFWLQYYHHNIEDSYRYKSYRQLKRDIEYLLPEATSSSASGDISLNLLNGTTRYHNNKVINRAHMNIIDTDILPSARALCACYLGRIDIVKESISQGATDFLEMLMKASCTGQEDIFDYLLTFESSFNNKKWFGEVMHSAIEGEQLHIVQKIIKLLKDRNLLYDSTFALMTATRVGNDEIFDYLFSIEPPHDYQEVCRMATMYDNLRIFKLCIPHLRGPPSLNARSVNPEILEEMIAALQEEGKSCDIHYKDLLHSCIISKDTARVQKYLSHYKKEYIFLPAAAEIDDVPLMKYFIEQGENDYYKALTSAAMNDSMNAIEYLLPLIQEKHGALIVLCRHGSLEQIKKFYKEPIDGEFLEKAFLHALCNGRGLEICKYLVERDPSLLSDKDEEYIRDMLGFCMERDNVKIFEYICNVLLDDDYNNKNFQPEFFSQHLLMPIVRLDNVDLLKKGYRYMKNVNNCIPVILDGMRNGWTYNCLKFLLDQGDIDVDELKKKALKTDPSVVYVIDKHINSKMMA